MHGVGGKSAAPRGHDGLSSEEAAQRLRRDGPNLLPQADRRNWLRIAGSVLSEPMLLLLVGAACVYLLLGDPQEAAVLAASVVLVMGLTVYQDYKSERALRALRDLSSPRARVLRDGQAGVVAAPDLVVGDVILIAEGDRVPADASLLEDHDLMLDESMLTGESVPVQRTTRAQPGQEEGLLRASTLVVRGHGMAQVTATGANTAVGHIGVALRTLHPPSTPMQREIRRAVMLFAGVALCTSVLMTLVYAAVHGDWLKGVLAGITLAMANIPEEFPVVLTVFLALGAWRMAGHRALVRRAPAIEALGAVTVLCTDKTGTLTENQMAVAKLVSGHERGAPSAALSDPLRALLTCADRASPEQPFDPMERAIRTAIAMLSVPPPQGGQRIREYPLAPGMLAMAYAWKTADAPALQVAAKGAPEAIADLCELPPDQRSAVLAEVDSLARRGLRVIAAASATWDGAGDTLPPILREFRFQWRGLLALADPLRVGVPGAMAEAQTAGVRVIMLTGDHLETARAIALQAGLPRSGKVVLGSELQQLEGKALSALAGQANVFARVKPEHKLRLIHALQRDGEVVAMTGDGVNDAPALMAAHVGVAMGMRGTDVAREAAAIVLLDDDFVTVVHAIRQGRVIYDNIVRAVRYILAVHVPITGLALLPLLFGDPLVLMPLHVVFLELIIDPASTLVFEREPAAPDVMRRPPRPPAQRLLDMATLFGSLGQGLAVFASVAAIYLIGRAQALPTTELAALSFTALIAGNLCLIVANRGGITHWQWWRQSNPAFWMVTLSALAMLVLVTRFEAPGHWFRFSPPPLGLGLVALLLPWAGLTLVETLRSMLKRVMAHERRTVRQGGSPDA